MRTAIRTYEGGGTATPFFQPLDPNLTPQASPVQPPPYAAGPTPTPSPPPQPPAPDQPLVPVSPQTAIRAFETPVQPEAYPNLPPGLQSDQDRFAQQEREDQLAQDDREAKLFDPKNDDAVFSHRGDFRQIAKAPMQANHEDDPRWANVQLAKQEAQKLDAKTRKEKMSQLNRIENQIIRDTDNKNKQANAAHRDVEKAELSNADAKDLDPTKAATLSSTIQTNPMTAVEAEYQKRSSTGRIQDQQDAQKSYAGSIFKTIPDADTRTQMVYNVMRLNRQLSPEVATKLVAEIGQPVPRGEKGRNGAVGPSAAYYDPVGKDVIGNRLVRTRLGIIRLSPDDYKTIKDARIDGYNKQKKWVADLQKAREEEDKPGLAARALKGAIDIFK